MAWNEGKIFVTGGGRGRAPPGWTECHSVRRIPSCPTQRRRGGWRLGDGRRIKLNANAVLVTARVAARDHSLSREVAGIDMNPGARRKRVFHEQTDSGTADIVDFGRELMVVARREHDEPLGADPFFGTPILYHQSTNRRQARKTV